MCVHAYPTAGLNAVLFSHDSPFDSAQNAEAFNQPLNLDTSSVTKMSAMLSVRSAHALPQRMR